MDEQLAPTGIAGAIRNSTGRDARVLAPAILIVSLAATLVAWQHQVRQTVMRGQQQFEQVSQFIVDDIKDSLTAYGQVLRASAAFLAVDREAAAAGWSRYVAGLDLASGYPGMQQLGVAAVLRTPAEMAALVQRMRAGGATSFAVHPDSDGPLTTPITLTGLSPGASRYTLGFDMYGDAIHRAAMDRAIDTGEPTLSAKVPLTPVAPGTQANAHGEGDGGKAGVLLVLPIFRDGASIGTLEARRAAFDAFVYSPLRMDVLIRDALSRDLHSDVRLARIGVFDGAVGRPDALLHASTTSEASAARAAFATSETIGLFGRQWTIRAVSTPQFEAQVASLVPQGVLVTGLVLSGLLAWLCRQLARRHRDVERVAQRTEMALDAGGTGTWTVDLVTGAVTLDDRARAVWGLGGHAVVTLDMLEQRIVAEDRPLRRTAVARSLDPAGDGRAAMEYRIAATRDRPERWVIARGQAEFVQRRAVKVSGTIRDITERKRAEQALAQSQLRLAGLVDQANDAIISIGADQRITLFNRGAEAMFGYAAREVIGQPLSLLIPPRARDAHVAHVAGFGKSAPVSRLMGERSEIVGLRKGGREFPAEASISRLDLASDAVFTAIVRDITERKRHQTELEAAVAERTRELRDEIGRREAAQSALVQAQRMDALGQLTGGIAHDSNNLLTVIAGNLEMVEDELGDHAAMKYVREAQEAAAMGARLNQRLLTFARRRKLEPQVLDLNDQVLAMSELLRRTLGEAINLATVLKHDLWSTRVDPSEVENAVLNLALNARDAMPRGGNLLIETLNVAIDADTARQIEGLEPGDYVRLSVSDTGVGMTPGVQRRVFEPFFTTKGPGKGTGLGLSSLYGFARQSKGHVTLYSEVGRGTTVNVYLPRVRAEDERATPRAAGEPARTARGETILVVEDNPQVRALTIERLRRLGYRILEADSGPAALALLDKHGDVDLVFSDVVMPGGMSGFDLARAVRERRPALPILLTSGFAEDVARNGNHAGEEPKILRKPYNARELADALRLALAP